MKSHSNFLETRRGQTAQHTTGVSALVVVLTKDRR